MDLLDIKVFVKSRLKFGSILYRFLKHIYYAVKILMDFILCKAKHPNAVWNYHYKNIERSYSQYGQDVYLLDLIGPNKRYVEVGANHPIRLSNSYLLEKNGWEGVSIDPLKKYINVWKEERGQPFINYAIGKEITVRNFVEFYGKESWYDMMSGFEDFIRPEDLVSFDSKVYEVKVVPLDSIIPFDSFELLLVDTEGAEMEVLEGIDLEKYKPKYVMLENAAAIGGLQSLRESMSVRGYNLIARIGCADDLYERSR